MIVATPGVMAVTTPVVETVATDGEPVVHVTTRPLRAVLSAASVVAVSVKFRVTITFCEGGETTTDATGTARTVTVVVPPTPSTLAVTVAVPAEMP